VPQWRQSSAVCSIASERAFIGGPGLSVQIACRAALSQRITKLSLRTYA